MKLSRCILTLLAASAVLVLGDAALAQSSDDTAQAVSSRTFLDLVQAGGLVGYAIILLSVVGVALIVDGFIRLRPEKLVPPSLMEQAQELARLDRFGELLNVCKANDSLLGRIVAGALSDGSWGLEAVRERMQQEGSREITHLRQRVGYIGLIASIAPMLGLLGTVVGMIASFKLLGEAKGAARPDELAQGISLALVTTCMGLIVAVPLMFFYAYLRDRITRIGQDAAAAGEKLLRIMSVVIDARLAAQPARARAATTVMPGGASAGTSLYAPPVPPAPRPVQAQPAPANGPRPAQPTPEAEPSGA